MNCTFYVAFHRAVDDIAIGIAANQYACIVTTLHFLAFSHFYSQVFNLACREVGEQTVEALLRVNPKSRYFMASAVNIGGLTAIAADGRPTFHRAVFINPLRQVNIVHQSIVATV